MDKNLGMRIKKCRHQKEFTSAQLAELCNIAPVYLRQIESGTKTPALDLFINICNHTQASPTYLLQDIVGFNELTEFPELMELWKRCSPAQTTMAIAMLKEAIKHTQ